MEVINSLLKSAKEKLTNPYFGTLIIVLLFHHWELLYTIFNFDDNVSLNIKLDIIKRYVSDNITFKDTMLVALKALFLMLGGYLVIVITRSIVLWVEFWLMPFITGKIISKNVVNKDDYDIVVKEREKYFDQYEEQRKYVRDFSKTIDEQTKQIKEKDKTLIDQSNTIAITVKELESTKINLEKSLNEASKKANKIESLISDLEKLEKNKNSVISMINKFQSLFFGKENKSFYSSIDKFPPEVINKIKELKEDNKWELFIEVGQFYNKSGTMDSKIITEMINRGLVFERDTFEQLTPVGDIIFHYREVFKDKN